MKKIIFNYNQIANWMVKQNAKYGVFPNAGQEAEKMLYIITALFFTLPVVAPLAMYKVLYTASFGPFPWLASAKYTEGRAAHQFMRDIITNTKGISDQDRSQISELLDTIASDKRNGRETVICDFYPYNTTPALKANAQKSGSYKPQQSSPISGATGTQSSTTIAGVIKLDPRFMGAGASSVDSIAQDSVVYAKVDSNLSREERDVKVDRLIDYFIKKNQSKQDKFRN